MIRPLSLALAAFLLAATPAAAETPSRLLHAELRDGGRLVWQQELVITLIPDMQMVGAQVSIPNPRADDGAGDDEWDLNVYPSDPHEPLPPQPPRGREEFQFSLSWHMPVDAETVGRDGERRPALRGRRNMSHGAAFLIGRHGRRSFTMADGLVITFWR
jgi:hypothetical protein